MPHFAKAAKKKTIDSLDEDGDSVRVPIERRVGYMLRVLEMHDVRDEAGWRP